MSIEPAKRRTKEEIANSKYITAIIAGSNFILPASVLFITAIGERNFIFFVSPGNTKVKSGQAEEPCNNVR